MTKYAAELTKQDLINLGITNCDKNGNIYGANGKLLKPRNKPSGKKFYKALFFYNKKTKKTRTIDVHRIIWIWFNKIQHDGMVIDHVNNDPFDNRLENLQELTPGENLAKDRPRKLVLKAHPRANNLEALKAGLAKYTALYEDAKKRHDAEAAHKYRSNIAQYKAKIRDWEENKEEYESIDQEKKAFLAFKQEHSKKARERAFIIKALKENIKKEKLAGNKEKWKAAIKMLNDYIEKNPKISFKAALEQAKNK